MSKVLLELVDYLGDDFASVGENFFEILVIRRYPLMPLFLKAII
jgi:hypothetical protein